MQSFLVALSAGLRKGLEGIRGAELIDAQREQRDSHRIRAIVRAPVVVGPPQVAVMQQAASAATGVPIQLTVRSVLTKESDSRAYLDEDAQTVVRQQVHDALIPMLERSAPDAELLTVHVEEGNPTVVMATIVAGRALSRRLVDGLNREISEAVGRSTRLTVRSVRVTSVAARDALLSPATHTDSNTPTGR